MMISQKPLSVFLTLIALVLVFPCIGQTVKLNDKISFSAKNISVTDALDLLSSQTGNTFSYNPDHIQTSRTIKVDLRDRQLIDVLVEILGNQGYNFKQFGNQIVIFRQKEIASSQIDEVLQSADDPSAASKTIPKVVAITDTVYITKNIHDTIKITEFITKTDTVIQKIATPVSKSEFFRNTIVLGDEFTKTLKFQVGASLSMFSSGQGFSAPEELTEKRDQFKKAYSDNCLTGSIGLDARATYQKWIFSTGIRYTSFNQRMDYEYLVQTGGYYRTDTLDSYYEIIEGEQKWTYLTDSVYVPVNEYLFDYKITNHNRYLEIPLTIGYNYPVANILLFANTGIITGFFLNSDGKQINVHENGVFSVDEMDYKKVVVSYTVSVGTAIPVSRKMILQPELFYRNHISSVYKDFPIETRFSAFGVMVGLSYKLSGGLKY